MRKIWQIIFGILFLGLTMIKPAVARENVTDWYIKDFQSQIVVNKDSTLTITENISANCGDAIDKHGIYRVLPLQSQKTEAEVIKSPVKLISITDFNNKPYNYAEIVDTTNHTITWKIGDPAINVRGINNYRISYIVKNAIRFDNPTFDEFYWNLNGNFWDMETDQFHAVIQFPAEITQTNTQTYLYSGDFGQKDEGLASYTWGGNVLDVKSKRYLAAKEGIAISVTTPKNIFTPYKLTAEDKKLYQGGTTWGLILSPKMKMAANVLGIIWPIGVLALCYFVWSRYGKDPKINRAVAPEFEIPNNLTPIEMGMIDNQGVLKNGYITATIVNLAVKKIMTIEVVGKKGILQKEDYKLKVTGNNQQMVDESEKIVFDKLFEGQTEIMMSSLQNKFYAHIPNISKAVSQILVNQNLIKRAGSNLKVILLVLAGLSFFVSFFLMVITIGLGAGAVVSAIIIFIFAFLMPSRTQEGAELEMRIKGFRMYMETAEKYQQQFNEKENIFERFLPYAILFGMTKEWLEKMKTIYGEEYFNSYQPTWLYGAMLTGGHFDLDNFTGTLNSMSSNMASTIASAPSSSGSGGGGFSGGGGGGGGGGGW